VIPIAATIALGVVWVLPLSWISLAFGAAACIGLPAVELARRSRNARRLGAVGSVSLAGAIALGYAASALASASGTGMSRLGYPFLIATGLRVPGGAGLLALLLIVAVSPLLFPDADPARASSHIG